MKHLLSMVAVMVGATTLFGNEACCAAVNLLTEQERQEGWRLLWDGKSGDGWRSIKTDSFPARGWEIANGELTVLPKNAGGGAGDIITRETYSSFILKVDFRLTEAANSGIKYFIDPAKTGGQPIGFEYQILDDAKHPDAKLGREGNRMQGSLYDVLPAARDKPVRPIGEWNEGRIVVRGAQIEHWLNGAKVLAVDRTSDAFKAAVAASKFSKVETFGKLEAGRILLQDHGDTVSFRNLRIRELAADEKK